LEIAEYFSPLLRRNTNLVPSRFQDVAPDPLLINLDVWRDHTRVDSATIDLGPILTLADAGRGSGGGAASSVGGAASSGAGSSLASPAVAAAADSLLLHLLQTRGPRRSTPPIVRPEAPPDTILFVDLPGEEDGSWRVSLGGS